MSVINGKPPYKPMQQLAQLVDTALLPRHGTAVREEKAVFHASACKVLRHENFGFGNVLTEAELLVLQMRTIRTSPKVLTAGPCCR